jgi:hypothetical protein
MLTTARDIIRGSLRLCKAIEQGEVPDEEEYNDALVSFNSMLDSWNVERLMLPFTASSILVATANQASYSVGPGGDWNIIRPQRVRFASTRVAGLDTPLNDLEAEQYALIPDKGTKSLQPTDFYYEPQFALGRLLLYPVPSVDINVILSYDCQLSAVTLDTDMSTLPPGYQQAMRFNLALMLAPEYSKTVSEEVKAEAKRSKNVIRSANSLDADARLDAMCPGVGQGGYNWRTDG